MTVLSWGANSYGQLGLGYRCEFVDVPQVVVVDNLVKSGEEDLRNIKSISGGGGHSLILTEEGSVYGCGWNNIGQLGFLTDGVVTNITRIKVLDDYSIVKLVSTWDSCYAITEDGLCIGWGSNVYGQLGKPMETVSTEKPIILAEDARQVACGARHCIILCNNGRILSSGDYKNGQLGRNVSFLDSTFKEDYSHAVDPKNWSHLAVTDVKLSNIDYEVSGLKNIELISCGFNHSLAMHESGEIYGWGANKWGQLGVEPTISHSIGKPTIIFSNENYNICEIHCGWSSSHLLTGNGVLINFGRNTYGQLGVGSRENSWKPKVHDDIRIKKISVGSEHCLALDGNDKLVSWGWNEHGSCGNGKTDNVLKPAKLTIPGRFHIKVKYFEAAVGHNYAIIED